MAQFHSLPVSEPVAQICGFLAGLSCYGFFSFLGADHDVCVGLAIGGSVVSNILIGGTINCRCSTYSAASWHGRCLQWLARRFLRCC